MEPEEIIQYVADTFEGVDVMRPTDGPGAGDTFFIYDPRGDLEPSRQFPFATIVTKDYGDFDNRSQLDRPGVYRVNVGVSQETFRTLMGHEPRDILQARPDEDFAALDRLLPHPAYAPQSWISVLNPSAVTFETLKPLR
jgi:hypothetical protein